MATPQPPAYSSDEAAPVHTAPIPTSRFGRLRHRMTYDDPNDLVTLQPHSEHKMVNKAELWGFFGFGFGFYTFSSVCVSLLLPIITQSVAHDASTLRSDPTVPCPEVVPEGDRCLVPFGFFRVTPTSYVLLINVMAVLMTIFTSLGVAAFADFGRVSKRMLLGLASMICVTSCFFFIGPIAPQVWWISGLAMVLAMIFNGVTGNIYEGLLPVLALNHPDVIRARVESGAESTEYYTAITNVQTWLSGGASAAGYAGSLILIIIVAMILLFVGDSTVVVGYCVIVCGAFVFVFVLVHAKLGYQRTFPPMPKDSNRLFFGYKRVGKTISQARKLKTLFFFLCTWFVLGDGLSASSNMAILIAQDSLKLDNTSLIIAALIQFITAGLGMTFWIWLQIHRGFSPLKTVILNSFLFGLLPAYCLLGLIDSSPIGMKSAWELYMLAAFFGFFQGAIYSSNRVVFSQFIPRGHENELFSLYEVAAYSSSWLAPLICTAIIEASSAQHTWWFLASQFFIPCVMLCFVNMEKGRAEAVEYAQNETRQKKEALLASSTKTSTKASSLPDEDTDSIKDVNVIV